MPKVRLSGAARADIESLLVRSELSIGGEARNRYQQLIATALKLIGEDVARGSSRDDIRKGLRVFHLLLARREAPRLGPTVKHPRHFLVYRYAAADLIEIVRVLHDARDLERHVPPVEE